MNSSVALKYKSDLLAHYISCNFILLTNYISVPQFGRAVLGALS